MSEYIFENCDIGKGFSPSPTSIVYPGLLYCFMNQSLYPAKIELYGVYSIEYPLTFANYFSICFESGGLIRSISFGLVL